MARRRSSSVRAPLRALEELNETALQVARAFRSPDSVAVLGGYAMQLYGSERLTKDLDVAALRAPLNLPRVAPLTFGGFTTRTASKIPVDIIVRDDESRALYRAAIRAAKRMPGVPLRVVTIPFLAAIKQASGRTKDEGDLEFLLLKMSDGEYLETRRIVKRFLGWYAARELDQYRAIARARLSMGRI